MAKKIAVFPGTFDPFTNGHADIVNRGLEIFDEVIVAIGVNASKKTLFSLEQRTEWIEAVFRSEPRVTVDSYEGLTASYAEKREARFLLRGLRTTLDFLYEKQIAFVNEDLGSQLQSVFIMSHHDNSSVSSTIVRDLIIHGGNYQKYLPKEIIIKPGSF
jgi:pantetheine-phosphate adenylyltransferase